MTTIPVTQDPKKAAVAQDPRQANTSSILEDAKKIVVTTALQDEIRRIMEGGGKLFGNESADDPLERAVQSQRDQETHEVNLQQAKIKARGSVLDNQRKEMDMEVKLAEAAQKGLIIPANDPKPVPQEPQKPSDGSAVVAATTEPKPNLSRGLFESIEKRRKELEELGQRKPMDTEAAKFDSFLREELSKALKDVSSEKHLSMGPFQGTGPLGNLIQILGGALDVVSGPLDLGTELLGGKLPASARAELFYRAIGSTSPLVRAQLQDEFNREKLEETAQNRLGRSGMGDLARTVTSGDQESVDAMMNTGREIETMLRNDADLQSSFGTDATFNLGGAFNHYQEIQKLLWDLRNASSKEELAEIEAQIQARDKAMREPIQEFYRRGGKPEQVRAELQKAIGRINKDYKLAERIEYKGSGPETNFAIREKLVAQSYVQKFTDFDDAIMGNIPIDIDENAKQRLTPEAYKRFKELHSKNPTIDVSKLAEIEEDVSRAEFWNPGKIETYLKESADKSPETRAALKKRLLELAPPSRRARIEQAFKPKKNQFDIMIPAARNK